MVLLKPREGGAQAANGARIRFGAEGFKAHYVENTDGILLMMAVRFMCSADVTENSDLLALNSIEEMGTEDEPFWTSFCKHKGSFLHMGDHGAVRLRDDGGVRCVPLRERPYYMGKREERERMTEMVESENWVVELGAVERIPTVRLTKRINSVEDVCSGSESKLEPGTTVRISPSGEITVRVGGGARANKPGPKKFSATGAGAGRTIPARSKISAQTVIASLGHISSQAAAKTVERMVGKMRERVDLQEVRAFVPRFPFNVAGTRKKIRRSMNDFQSFKGDGKTPGNLTQYDTVSFTESIRGFSGAAVAIDACVGYGTMRLFRGKRDAGGVIDQHAASAKRFGVDLEYGRPDNGTEISNASCKARFDACGQIMEVASTANPNHIAKAERRIGLLLGMAIAMIDHAFMPWCFWDAAMEAANDTLNGIVRNGEERSPYEQWRQGERWIKHDADIFGERWMLKKVRRKGGDPTGVDRIGYYVRNCDRQPGQKVFMVPPVHGGEKWTRISWGNSRKLDDLTMRRTKPPTEMKVLFEAKSPRLAVAMQALQVTAEAPRTLKQVEIDDAVAIAEAETASDENEDDDEMVEAEAPAPMPVEVRPKVSKVAEKPKVPTVRVKQPVVTGEVAGDRAQVQVPTIKIASIIKVKPRISPVRRSLRRTKKYVEAAKRMEAKKDATKKARKVTVRVSDDEDGPKNVRPTRISVRKQKIVRISRNQVAGPKEARRRSRRVQDRESMRQVMEDLDDRIESNEEAGTRHGESTTQVRFKKSEVTYASGEINWKKLRKMANKYEKEDIKLAWEECYVVEAGNPDKPRRREWLGTAEEHDWMESEADEISSQVDCGAWDLVQRSSIPRGTRVMKSGWTYLKKRCKKTGRVLRMKSRLHVCGYTQVKHMHFDRTYSPVAKAAGVRMVMAIAAGRKMELRMTDVSTAFLQSELIFSNLYAEMAPGYELIGPDGKKMVMLLKRPVYGAKQSSRRFYKRADDWLIKHGFTKCSVDSCVYRRKDGENEIVMAVHVDDFTCAVTSQEYWDEFMAEFTDVKNGGFKARDEGRPEQVLGGAVTYGENGEITWSHEMMCEKLFDLVQQATSKTMYTKGSPGVKGKYLSTDDGPEEGENVEQVKKFPIREVNGLLCYLANTSRPDIAFEVSQTARFNDCPTAKAIAAIVRIAEYLNRTKTRGITWGGDRAMDQPVTFGDASHCWEPNKGWGTGGHVVMMYGGAIAWRSKSIKLIVRGTRDSEAHAMCAAVEAALWAREWLRSFGYLEEAKPSTVYTDSSCLVDGLGDGSFNSSRRAILIAGLLMRQEIKNGEIEMVHISGSCNIADILTKSEVPDVHGRLATAMIGEARINVLSAGKFGKATANDFK